MAASGASSSDQGQANAAPAWKDILTSALGVLALIGFAIFVAFLLRQAAGAEELAWTRLIYVFSGVEAIAFAAAGYFFGREVQRARAENAESTLGKVQAQAESAREQANALAIENQGLQTRGEMLAEAIRAKAGGRQVRADSFSALGVANAVPLAQADYEELVQLADKAFPGL
jgi:hypothetical protein